MAKQTSLGETTMSSVLDIERHSKEKEIDYTQRSQWLRAAVLGAYDGLVSTASLMMGIGAVKQDAKVMMLTGFAGLVAGACSMAVGEFVSVYSQLDIEVAQKKRNQEKRSTKGENQEDEVEEDNLPNPVQAAFASALAFSIGSLVPLLAASFTTNYRIRLVVIAIVVSLALMVLGGVCAVLGKAPLMKSGLRGLIGGWLAMAITFGMTRWVEQYRL